MTQHLIETEDRLLELLEREARGPGRNALYALWLFTRVADGALAPDQLSPRAHGRRVEHLERRLSSLSVPAPIRKGLAAGLRQLREGTPPAAAIGLQQMVAPTRETLGNAAADALGAAVRTAREAAKSGGT